MNVMLWYSETFTSMMNMMKGQQLKEDNKEQCGKYAAIRQGALFDSLLHLCVSYV